MILAVGVLGRAGRAAGRRLRRGRGAGGQPGGGRLAADAQRPQAARAGLGNARRALLGGGRARPAPPTWSTGRPRPASTRSRRVSATLCTTRECGCWSCVPDSCTRRMTQGLRAGAPVDHTAGGRPRRRGGTGPRRWDRVGAVRPALAYARGAHASPSPLSPPETVSAVTRTRDTGPPAHPPSAGSQTPSPRFAWTWVSGSWRRWWCCCLGPGLAIVAIAALLVLAVCVLSIPLGRRRSRRR